MRKFGPKQKEHPTVGTPCPACGEPFKEGEYTCLTELGPGADKEAQAKARIGCAYNAVAVEVHWACATGEESNDERD